MSSSAISLDDLDQQQSQSQSNAVSLDDLDRQNAPPSSSWRASHQPFNDSSGQLHTVSGDKSDDQIYRDSTSARSAADLAAGRRVQQTPVPSILKSPVERQYDAMMGGPRQPSFFESNPDQLRAQAVAEGHGVKPEPQRLAEDIVGHPVAPPAGGTDPFSPQELLKSGQAWTNPRTGQRVALEPVPEQQTVPVLDAWTGVEPLASGLSRIHENDVAPYAADPRNPFGPPVRTMSPEEEEKHRRQMMQGASEVLQGGMTLSSPVAAASFLTAPVKVALGVATGLAASEAGGAAIHGHVSPEAEELGRNLFFFAPSAFGVIAGLRSGVIETQGGKFYATRAFGGNVRAGAAVTPEIISARMKVGGTQFEVNIPRGKVAPTPPPSEAAKALGDFEQHSGNPDFQAPPQPPPPPGSNGPEHMTPQVVEGVSAAIRALPPEAQPNAMLEAHGKMVQWMMARGTFVGPDGKVYSASNPGQAKSLASKFINDHVDDLDKRAEEAQKAAQEPPQGEAGAKPQPTPQTPQAQPATRTVKAAKAAAATSKPTQTPISGSQPPTSPAAAPIAPMGRGMTTDSPAVAKVAQEARLAPGQVPRVEVKQETPADAAALAQPPKVPAPAAVEKVGQTDKESGRQIVQPSGNELENERLAAQAAPELATGLSEIAAQVDGAHFDAEHGGRLRPQKNLERVGEKTGDGDKPANTIGDYLASQIVGDTVEAKDKIIAGLKEKYNVLGVEDNFLQPREDKAGYASANIQVQMPNGSSAEVQVVIPEIQRITDQTHRLYTSGREFPDGSAERKKYWDEAAKVHEAAVEAFRERTGLKEQKFEKGSTQINIAPDSDLGKAHAEATASIPGAHLMPTDFGGNPKGREDKPHITVRYGLKDDSTEAVGKLRAALEKIQPFDLTVGTTDAFEPSEHSDGSAPIIARIETTPELTELIEAIEGAADFDPETFKKRKHHITLGYVDPKFAHQYVGRSDLKGHSVRVDHIAVSKKDGSQETLPLGGKIEAARIGSSVISLDDLEAQQAKPYTGPEKRFNHIPLDSPVAQNLGRLRRELLSAPEEEKAGIQLAIDREVANIKGERLPIPEQKVAGITKEDVERHAREAPAVGVIHLDELDNDNSAAANLKPGEHGQVDPRDLGFDPKRFQYKLNTNERGVTGQFAGTRFNPQLAGVVSVWRDPRDGKLYVVNGHHRAQLALQSGQKTLHVHALDVPDEGEARSVGALQNIADGKGTAIDAAKYFRETGITPEKLDGEGVSLTQAIASNGLALSQLDPSIFEQVATGKMSEGRGVAIGAATGDPAQQEAIVKLIQRRETSGKSITNGTVAELSRFVANSGNRTIEQGGLFGANQQIHSLALEKAEISAYIKQRIARERRSFGAVATQERAAQLAKVEGQQIKPEENQRISQGAAQAEEAYNKLSSYAGPVNDILEKAARDLASGNYNPEDIRSTAYQAIRAELSQALGRSADAGAPAVQESAGSQPAISTKEPKRPVSQNLEPSLQRESRSHQQTETSEFKKWFGESKVVNPDGTPMVVYHGTNTDFDSFKPAKDDIGIHFGTAAQAGDRMSLRTSKYFPNTRILPVYLKIENPLQLHDLGQWDAGNVKRELERIFPEEADKLKWLPFEKQVREFIQGKGYDGIVYKNEGEWEQEAKKLQNQAWRNWEKLLKSRGRTMETVEQQDLESPEWKAWNDTHDISRAKDSYIVFDPSQIKSAIGNKGTFDPSNTDISLHREYGGGLSPDELLSWVRAAGNKLRIEDYGKQGSLFGDPENVYRLTNSRGESTIATQAQLNALKRSLPSLADKITETGTAQPGLFPARELFRDPETGELKTKIGMNKERGIRMTITGLYRDRSPAKMTAEIVQNAFDEVMNHADPEKRSIVFKSGKEEIGGEQVPYIEVSDTGRGLTPEQLGTVFTDVYESGKTDAEGAAGGWGVAKTSFQLGGRYFRATSQVKIDGKLKRFVIEGTPNEMLEGVPITDQPIQEQKQGLLARLRNRPSELVAGPQPNGTGLSVRVYLKEGQEPWDANNYFNTAGKISSKDVSFYSQGDWYSMPLKVEPDLREPLGKVAAKGADVTLESGPTSDYPMYYMPVHVTNKGLYQFTWSMNLGEELTGVPGYLVADVDSKVRPGHEDYPFTQSREDLVKSVQGDVTAFVTRNLLGLIRQKQMEKLQAEWRSIGDHQLKDGTAISIYSERGLHSDLIGHMVGNPYWNEYLSTVRGIQDWFGQRFGKDNLPSVSRRGVFLPTDKPDQITFGINIPNPSTNGKDQAIFLNPFGVARRNEVLKDAEPIDTAWAMASHQLNTILHEYAHNRERTHGVAHNAVMAEFNALLPPSKEIEFKKSLADAIAGQQGADYESAQPARQFTEALSKYRATLAQGNEGRDANNLRSTGVESSQLRTGPDEQGRIPDGDRRVRPSGERTPAQAKRRREGPLDAASNAVRDFLAKRQERQYFTAQARELESGLAVLDRKYEAHILDTRNMLRSVNKAFGPQEQEHVYHSIEASSDHGLTAEEKTLKDNFVQPVQDINRALRDELSGYGWGHLFPETGYIHRIVEGKSSRLQSAVEGQGRGKGNILSQSASSTKGRTMFALEDEDGHRLVVHKANGRITGFDQGKAVDMGPYKQLSTGDTFHDKDGQPWTLAEATTKEIEGATNLSYYKNAMAVTAVDNLELQRAVNAARYLEDFKGHPEFSTVAVQPDAGAPIPNGWKQTHLPQFRGYAFEPRTREVLDGLYDRIANYEPPTLLEKVGDALQTSVLLNPLMHVANMADIWANERGVLKMAQVWKGDKAVRAGMRALQAVTMRNQDYLEALDQGAPLMSHKSLVRDVNRALLETLTGQMSKEPGLADKVREALGMAKGDNPLRAVKEISHAVAFMSNDVFLLQSVYDKMESSGVAFPEALRQTMRMFPEYRVPTRVLDSKALADFLKNRLMTWFSGYHYGRWRAYRNTVADSVRPGASAEDRTWALSRLAMLGLLAFVAYPLYDKMLKYLTGDPHARSRRFGLSSLPADVMDVHWGKKDITAVLESQVTPSALLKAGAETFFNRDTFTGQHVYDPSASLPTELLQAGEHVAKHAIGPVSEYERYKDQPGGFKKLAWSMAGVGFPKSETDTQALIRMHQIQREHSSGMAEWSEEEKKYEEKQARLAAGKLTRKELLEARKSEFLRGMERFSYQEAKQVYDLLSPEEREAIGGPVARIILMKKFHEQRTRGGAQ